MSRSVGNDLGDGWYKDTGGTVVDIDRCVYGIPNWSKRILKYDPINDITSFVGEEADEAFQCEGDGASWEEMAVFTRSLKMAEF